MSRRAWLLGSVAVLLVGAGIVRGIAPGVVRARLESAALRVDAEVTSAEISVGFGHVKVENLRLALRHAPDVQVSLDEIDVALTWSLRPENVEARGLHLVARGPAETLRRELQESVTQGGSTPASQGSSQGAGATRPPVHLVDATLRWEGADPSLPSIIVSGGELTLNGAALTAVAAKIDVQSDRGSVQIRGGHIEFYGNPALETLRGLGAGAIDLDLTSKVGGVGGADETALAAEATSATTSISSAPSKGGPQASATTTRVSVRSRVPAKNSPPGKPDVAIAHEGERATKALDDKGTRGLARLAPLVARARALSLEMAPLLTTLPPIGTKALRITIPHQGATLVLGPSEATVERRGDSTLLELAAVPEGEGAKGNPLSLALRIPDRADDPTALDVRGGPIPLSLVLHDPAAFHLIEAEKSTVEVNGSLVLSPDGTQLSWKGSASAQGLAVDHRKLASTPVRGLGLRVSGEATTSLDLRSIKVARASLSSSGVTAEISGELERQADHTTIQAKINVPLGSCQAVIEGLSPDLIPMLAGAKMTGTFSAQGGIRFDSSKPTATDVALTLLNECRFVSVPAGVDIARFRGPITRRVYHPDGTRFELATGPGTPTWVSYGAISPFMTAAVQMTEDGAFYRHRGFDIEAIRNSIKENLNEGKFKRGASTISMQTAKNLYLDREKTLSRKFQEALLTTYLEQVLSKEQILELYFNNIEFAPNVYGIGPAAAHYFHTSAGALSLGQALYISSILPNPKVQHFGAGGVVSPGWMSLLHKWMRHMSRLNLISEVDMAEGVEEQVIFGQPRPERVRGVDGEVADPQMNEGF